MKKCSFKYFFLSIFVLSSFKIAAQDIRLETGQLPDFSNQNEINIEFSYEKMGVGRYTSEEEYIKDNIAEFNTKEPGRGDKWAEGWVNDRKKRYEPKFIEIFQEYSKLTFNKDAHYTIIFHTTFTEPGFHTGPIKRNAFINAEAFIVNTQNKDEILAKFLLSKAPGKASIGYGYDTAQRIAGCYGTAAKALGNFLRKRK